VRRCLVRPGSGVRICYHAAILSYGQITGTDNGVERSGFIELDDTGAPISEFVFIPAETMPEVVPVWTIELPISDDAGVRFTQDEAANLALIKMLRSMVEPKGLDTGS
jgi:hypothetical protein